MQMLMESYMTEVGMMKIYWTKIKLWAAANQAIYLVIFHWVAGSLYHYISLAIYAFTFVV